MTTTESVDEETKNDSEIDVENGDDKKKLSIKTTKDENGKEKSPKKLATVEIEIETVTSIESIDKETKNDSGTETKEASQQTIGSTTKNQLSIESSNNDDKQVEPEEASQQKIDSPSKNQFSIKKTSDERTVKIVQNINIPTKNPVTRDIATVTTVTTINIECTAADSSTEPESNMDDEDSLHSSEFSLEPPIEFRTPQFTAPRLIIPLRSIGAQSPLPTMDKPPVDISKGMSSASTSARRTQRPRKQPRKYGYEGDDDKVEKIKKPKKVRR